MAISLPERAFIAPITRQLLSSIADLRSSRMRRMPGSAVLLLVILLAAPTVAAAEVDYVHDIKPIFRAHCYACHGALRQKSKLRLDTAAFIRQGGRHGPALVSGKSGASILIDAVTGHDRPRMPPEEEGKPLAAQQIALLRAWIDQGAKAPDEPVPEDPHKHWAFQRPARSAVPRVALPVWMRNPLDAFVAAEHAKHGLHAVPAARKETLLRRVYLDLTGLPPTRAELHAFLADGSDEAYEKVVDHLLASPQYGERWARHWMDVWRYADWYGRRGVPDVWNSAPQVWRWRDWIVNSLNMDKGYDRMIREMLAGDEIAPRDENTIVATGYIARNWYALNYNQWMRDLVEHTGKAFLGLTFNCCHCHDHKYDPLLQQDYFRFRAFFEPLELRQDRLAGEPDPGPFQKYEYSVLRKVVHTGAIRVFDEKVDAKTFMYRGGDERNRMENKPAVSPGVPSFLGGERLEITPVELPADSYYPGLQAFIQQDEVAKRQQVLTAARAAGGSRLALAEAELAAVKARIAADNARYKRTAGNAEELARAAGKAERFVAVCVAKEKFAQAERALAEAKRKDAATAKTKEQPSAAVNQAAQQLAKAKKDVEIADKSVATPDTKYTPLGPIYPARSSGRRRALASWIGSRDNPLTARVAVNHIWMRHFGRPLVESVFDFGRNGKRPSHPELLDWLAVEFIDSGWSMKHLHRLIVTSNTYQLQSVPVAGDDSNFTRDTDNHWLWHFPQRRLEAEVVRDNVLGISGQLDLQLGGRVLENTEEANSRRRSLYFSVYPEGGGHLKMLSMFDAPDPCDCYRRSESIVPQQALLLTNSQLMLDASRLLARRLSKELGPVSESAFVLAAFEQVLCRQPTSQERAACEEFLRRQRQLFTLAKLQTVKGEGKIAPSLDPILRAQESLVRALFSHDDFVTLK